MPKSNYGKNVTPSWMSWDKRKDGKESIVYGKHGQSEHGHTVRDKDGKIVYSRSIGGRKHDTGR
jgi:hypothetical protein